MKILVADDSITNLKLITTSLRNLGHEVVAAANGPQAIKLFKETHPDLIILDVVMGEMNGFDCAKKIRDYNTDDWIPIIFLSGTVDDDNIARGIDAGGDDYLTKPFSDITLAAKIKAMQRISNMRQNLYDTTKKLSMLSSTDTLTGIYNRLQFNKTIKERIAQSERQNTMFALLFLDVDNFKLINDTLGHHAGDSWLIEVSHRLQACLRANDFVARIGGDEFAVILSDFENKNAVKIVTEKIIQLLSSPFNSGEQTIQSSCSIGVVFYPEDGLDPESLTKNADLAMYRAKSTGRNNCQYFSKALLEAKQLEKISGIDTRTNLIKKNEMVVLNCLVNETRIGIDLQFIKKNVPLPQLQTMPNSFPYLVGLMNVAGDSIPVIDLGARLNLIRDKPYSLSTPILLCSDGLKQVGFIVDKILDLKKIDEQDFQKEELGNKLIYATTIIDSELTLIVNMHYLLTMD